LYVGNTTILIYERKTRIGGGIILWR
jgi:hypothetical protein